MANHQFSITISAEVRITQSRLFDECTVHFGRHHRGMVSIRVKCTAANKTLVFKYNIFLIRMSINIVSAVGTVYT